MVTLTYSCLCAALLTTTLTAFQGWRGIVPLRSTRADVEKLLGPPADSGNKFTSVYQLENETVVIDYEDDEPCTAPGGWRVPRGTVTSVTITPKTRLRFSDLKIDEGKYNKTDGGHRPEDTIYTNDESGERITVYRGDVTLIAYGPTAGDSRRRCSASRAGSAPARRGSTYFPLDTYHDISFEEEKSPLDNFAINLTEDRTKKGYIVVYAGRDGRAAAARARAERAKNYLVNERGIKARRVVTMYGGRRETFAVELYILPGRAPAPTPHRTLSDLVAPIYFLTRFEEGFHKRLSVQLTSCNEFLSPLRPCSSSGDYSDARRVSGCGAGGRGGLTLADRGRTDRIRCLPVTPRTEVNSACSRGHAPN